MMKKTGDDLEEGKENGERWLLTYSDMITLLLALFIIMFGMSSANSEKVQQMSQGLENALNNPSASQAVGTGAGVVNGELDEIYSQLNKYISENSMGDTVTLTKTSNTLVVHLKDSVLFQPDTAVLLDGSGPVLQEISQAVQSVYGKVGHVTITGNVADVGSRDQASAAHAWQLSVDRAVRVLNSMAEDGVPPEKLSIEGNSYYKPVADNATPEGRAQNRRVEITISAGSQSAASK